MPKTISLSKATLIVGGIVTLTGYGEAHAAALTSRVGGAASELGLGVAVTSTTIVAAIVLLKLASHAWPRFGRSYRAFLLSYGLRP